MQPIVCATRGGEVSRRTQERAVALAKERGTEVVFLYVIDPSFSKTHNELLAAALADELERLGRSLLSIAQARAKKQGVIARTAILHGTALQNIEEYVQQVDAGALVIGAPRTSSALQALEAGGIHRFAVTIHEATGVEVVVVT